MDAEPRALFAATLDATVARHAHLKQHARPVLDAAAAIHLNVPSPDTARVQQVHRTVLHVMCDLVERAAVDA